MILAETDTCIVTLQFPTIHKKYISERYLAAALPMERLQILMTVQNSLQLKESYEKPVKFLFFLSFSCSCFAVTLYMYLHVIT